MRATAARFGNALDWLVNAGLVSLCHRVTRVETPLVPFAEFAAFKAFHMDVGLFGAMAGFLPEDILLARPGVAFGGLTETYVANALCANGVQTFYWAPDSRAEVDFVYAAKAGGPVAVEVKRGVRVGARSLDVLRARFPGVRTIRLSERGYGRTEALLSLPLYAAFLLE